DLGGGGLTCAVSEMCSKGGTGAELDLDCIHMREANMTPYEILLSESQERMLLAVDPDGLEAACEPFRKFEVSHAVVGRVTGSGRLVARWKGQVVVDLPAVLITSCPEPPRFALRPKYADALRSLRLPREPDDLTDAVLRVVSSPNLASKGWIYRQYDHEVGIATVLKPGDGDAAVLRILETNRGVAVKGDCNTLHSYLDPFHGAAGALVETVRNVVAVGGRPLAYTDGCNFGNPEKPDVFWQFSESIRGLAYAGRGLNVPCVGGNVSFYNDDEETGQSVKPVTVVIAVGVIDDLEHTTSMALKTTRGAILVLGETLPELGGSEYLHAVHGLVQGSPPKVRLRQERAAHAVAAEAINAGLVEAVHDCSKGGLAAALALMAAKGRRGLSVEMTRVPQRGIRRMDELLFSESHSRFVVETSMEDSARVLKIAKRMRCPAAIVGGTLDRETYAIVRRGKPVVECSIKELESGWSRTLPEAMGDM
ncbi:MAG: AIR synthase-related protein, partial [Candidatus Bathyarchaeia archaeon]